MAEWRQFALDPGRHLGVGGAPSAGVITIIAVRLSAMRDGASLAVDGVIVEVWLFGADQSTEDAFRGS